MATLIEKAIEAIQINEERSMGRNGLHKDYHLVCHSRTWKDLCFEFHKLRGSSCLLHPIPEPGYVMGIPVLTTDHILPGIFLILTPETVRAMEESDIMRGKRPFN